MKIFILNRKRLILFCTILICAISVSCLNTFISVSNNKNKKVPIYSVARDDNKIAITFNCAWGNEDINQILETLKKHNVKATFFIVGQWAEKYPDEVKQIINAGHEIGAHSYNHAHYNKMNYNEILTDIKKCDSVIENICEKNVYLVRGGYGEYNEDVLKACENSGNTYIQWSVDSIDYNAKNTDDIINRVLTKTLNGDIILMHTGTEYTSASLDSLLSELLKSYNPVTISELIYAENFTIDHTGKQHQYIPDRDASAG